MTLSTSTPISLEMGWQQLVRGKRDQISERLVELSSWTEKAETHADAMAAELKWWEDPNEELLLEYRELRGQLSRAKRVQRVLEGELARRKT